MKKLFMQLISEFKRLGAIVVHADFNRVILCTKKRSLSDALAYVEYVTNTIHNKELFHSIDMRFTQAWDFLLWCDPSNYGGIKSKLPNDVSIKAAKQKNGNDEEKEEEQKQQETEFSDDEDDSAPEIEMNWNLSTYLPEEGACQKNFNTVVAGYVMAIYSQASLTLL
jgi:DNA polymerase epsilon subunit 1